MNTPPEPMPRSGFDPPDVAASSVDTAETGFAPPPPAPSDGMPPPPVGARPPRESPPTSSPPTFSDQLRPERRKPARSGLRATAAGICLTLAVLLIIPALLARWVRTDVVSSSGFADNAVALLDVPEVRNEIVELIAEEMMQGVTARPRRVRPLVVAAVDEMVQSEEFEASWRDAAATTHDAVMASLLGRDRGSAQVVDNDVIVELDAPLDGLRRLLDENGIEADLDDVPGTLQVELADLPGEDSAIADILSRVDSAGLWLPVGVVLLLVGGLAAAVNRWRTALITGIGLAVSGIVLVIALSSAQAPLAEEMASGGTLTESGVESLVDVFTGSLGTMARWVIALGITGVVVGTTGLVLRARRS